MSRKPATIPRSLNRFIGREREIDQLVALLKSGTNRLISITGTGGVGKTRLALAAGRVAQDGFTNGARFIELAPVRDPQLVPQTIATALAVRTTGEAIADALAAELQTRDQLLVLDNFEHVLAAAPLILQLVTACPQLTALVTSRERLRLSGETEFPVWPLTLPDHGPDISIESARASAAIALFVDRAVAADPAFALTPNNVAAVAAICQRLDGLPLAIEMAASRSALLSPEALLPRLDSRLPLLSARRRDLPERHQTIAHAIAWSVDLLDEEERRLFSALSVFSGSISVEAAEAISQMEPVDDQPGSKVIDMLQSFVDKHLIRLDVTFDDKVRFGMLETIREYAREMLEQSGLGYEIRERQAQYIETKANSVHATVSGSVEEAAAVIRFDRDHANLRVVLQWLESTEQQARMLAILTDLVRYWRLRGYLSEGRLWLEQALAGPDPANALTGHALETLSLLCRDMGDYADADIRGKQALDAYRNAGDDAGISRSLNILGVIEYRRGDYSASGEHARAALLIQQAAGLHSEAARSLHNLGCVEMNVGNLAGSESLLRMSEASWRSLEDTDNATRAVSSLASLAALQGRFDEAVRLFSSALVVWRGLEHQTYVAEGLSDVAASELKLGQLEQAGGHLRESLAIYQTTGPRFSTAETIEACAGFAIACGETARAAGWLDAAAGFRETTGIIPPAHWRAHLNEWQRAAAASGHRPRDQPRGALDEAIKEASLFLDTAQGRAEPPISIPDRLTPREIAVLRLVVAGMSDQAIADTLLIARRTASKHVSAILGKLGVASRVTAAVTAVRTGIV